jgi:hypothetical protein
MSFQHAMRLRSCGDQHERISTLAFVLLRVDVSFGEQRFSVLDGQGSKIAAPLDLRANVRVYVDACRIGVLDMYWSAWMCA